MTKKLEEEDRVFLLTEEKHFLYKCHEKRRCIDAACRSVFPLGHLQPLAGLSSVREFIYFGGEGDVDVGEGHFGRRGTRLCCHDYLI